MLYQKLLGATLFLLFSYQNFSNENDTQYIKPSLVKPTKISEIALPQGFERVNSATNSFAFFLQHFALKADNTIYFYDGRIKENQSTHYAILDIPIGKKNLQQCADAVMRLKATYHYLRKEYPKIKFSCGANKYAFNALFESENEEVRLKKFESFLETVFINCGTCNLADVLHQKSSILEMSIGDVFVKPGSPGHAMIVVDMAINKKTNEKIYLLAQSFMPAQSVHIVNNEENNFYSPWYKLIPKLQINTPGYIFNSTDLKEW